LLEIAGKPLIVWVAERARAARTVSRTIVATDDTRIAAVADEAGFDVVMTRADHKTGTDRIAEVAHNLHAEIIVNVQGDEPLIDPATIDVAVNALMNDPAAQMSTTYESIEDTADVLNPSVVKVAFDDDGYATMFSRRPVPFANQAVEKSGSIEAALRSEPALLFHFKKHTGLYAYRRNFLLEFTRWPQSEREREESLEQMRALDRAVKIKVVEAASRSIGVDTLEDLERVRVLLESNFGERSAATHKA
jgi:3-deoxy-manno-octulosonate cytidylyltransferase (CMP-KDO synthetase)